MTNDAVGEGRRSPHPHGYGERQEQGKQRNPEGGRCLEPEHPCRHRIEAEATGFNDMRHPLF